MPRYSNPESHRLHSLEVFLKRGRICTNDRGIAILNSLPDLVWQVDASGRFVFANESFLEVFGRCREEIVGQSLFDLMPFEDLPSVRNRFLQYSQQQLPMPDETIKIEPPLGTRRIYQTKAAPCFDRCGDMFGYAGVLRDITEMVDRQSIMEYLATHDSLTGLHNRYYFDDFFNRLRLRNAYPFGFVIADVDNLGLANDTMGHAGGDLHLQRAAHVLKKSFRPDDVVARFGGDEFVVIVDRVSKFFSRDIKKRIAENVALDNQEYPQSFPLGLSLGAGIVRNDRQAQKALEKADNLLYSHKKSKKHH